MIIGAAVYSSSTGRAYVYNGSASGVPTTASTTLTGPGTSYFFGTSVSGAGDVNSDGYDDVIVGTLYWNVGLAYVHHGSASGVSTTASTTLTAAASGTYFGSAVSGAGDVNGDGYDDVIVGTGREDSYRGAAYTYHGSSSGVRTTVSTTLRGEASSHSFGQKLSDAGDVNGDGYDDVIIGANLYSSGYYFSGEGKVYVYHGSASGLSSSASTSVVGGGYGYRLGYSLSIA